jgi:hypothetical protein
VTLNTHRFLNKRQRKLNGVPGMENPETYKAKTNKATTTINTTEK